MREAFVGRGCTIAVELDEVIRHARRTMFDHQTNSATTARCRRAVIG